jgi:sensor histidine kinase YesM
MLVRAIYNSKGVPAALISVESEYAYLTALFDTLAVGKNGNYRLVGADGEILFADQNETVGKNASDHPFTDPNTITFSETLSQTPIRIDVAYGRDIIDDMGRTQQFLLFITAAVFVALAVLLIFVISRLTTSRVSLLLHNISRMRLNEPAAGELPGRDEIALISSRFWSVYSDLRDKKNLEDNLRLRMKMIECDLLQEQINPHFLYNTLSAIRWSVLRNKDADSAAMIDKLVGFYRMALGEGREICTVEDELDMIVRYIEIQKYSYDDEYEVEIKAANGTRGLFCLKFLLQPLVENAIKHGFEDMTEGRFVSARPPRPGVKRISFIFLLSCFSI